MKLVKFYYIVIKILFISYYVECEKDETNEVIQLETETMIDPHSYYFQRYEKKDPVQSDLENLRREENYYKKQLQLNENSRNEEAYMRCKIYYKRLINMLLSNTAMKQEGDLVEGKLHIEATVDQLETLRNLGNDDLSLQEIDLILSKIIKKPQFNILEEATYFTEHLFRIMSEHKEIIFPSIMTLLMLTIFKNIMWSKCMIIMFILSAILLISFVITYWQLIQEVEIKLTAMQFKFNEIPVACFPNKMSIFEKVSAFFHTNNDCEEYHKAVMTNSKLQVTPALVLSRLFATIIFQPLSIFGHAVSEFIENATGNLSGPLRWLVICLLFLAVGLLLVVLPFCISGGAFSVALGPLFRFSLNGPTRSSAYEQQRVTEHSTRPERIENIQQVSDDRSATTKAAITCSHDHDNCITIKFAGFPNTAHNEYKRIECIELRKKEVAVDDGSGDAKTHEKAEEREKEEDKEKGNLVKIDDKEE